MNNKVKFLGIVLLMLFFSFPSTAQNRILIGRIFTLDSIPLINVNIKVKSTKQVFKSDTTGRFSVWVNSGDKIIFSAKGFFPEKVKLKNKIKSIVVNLKLKPGVKNREYAIGYGHVSDVNNLNAISSFNDKEMDFSKYKDVEDIISGRFAGVQIINGEIIIRGVNSINCSNAALIVVDGQIVDNRVLNTLSPSDIKNINIIKDGSAAIYGSRGANGVVIIETKTGKEK